MWSVKIRHHSSNYEEAKANCTHCYHPVLLDICMTCSLMVYRETVLEAFQTISYLTFVLHLEYNEKHAFVNTPHPLFAKSNGYLTKIFWT